MKVLTGALAAALSLIGSHAAAAAYGTAGCGLGSIVIGPKPGFMQVVAATLNMTGVQTFGITTGTSNCADKGGGDDKGDEGGGDKKKKKEKKDKKSSSLHEQIDFVTVNMNSLKRDTAKGAGDTLAALASTLGCDSSALPEFARSLQGAHGQIFASAVPTQVLANIKVQVQAVPSLAVACDAQPNDLAQAQ